MSNRQKIDEIFKVLVEFENIGNQQYQTTEESYLAYLDRLCTYYLGTDKEEIYNQLKGLHKLGIKANHDTVKRIVFHIINLLDKEV